MNEWERLTASGQETAWAACAGAGEARSADPGTAGPYGSRANGLAPGLVEGTVLAGRYRVGELLGQGGFARVYAAWDLALRRQVAVKVYPESAGRLCRDEARLQSAVQHPNVMPLYDAGADPLHGVTFLVLPRYPGADLGRALALRGALSPGATARVADQVCSALDYLTQRRQAVHGDVKPSNIWVSGSGGVLLMDFNLHGLLVWDETGRAGTPGYTAPEALEGAPDLRSDVFSLGCVVYECLTGTPAFRSDAAAAAGEYVPVRRLRPEVSPDMEGVVRTALQPDPGRRYQTARELQTALRGARRRRGYRLDGSRVLWDTGRLTCSLARMGWNSAAWYLRRVGRRPMATVVGSVAALCLGRAALDAARAWAALHPWEVGAAAILGAAAAAAGLAWRWQWRPRRGCGGRWRR